MVLFLKSLEGRVAKVITKEFKEPQDDEDTLSEIETNKFDANFKDYYALMQALNDNDLSRVINCPCAYDLLMRVPLK